MFPNCYLEAMWRGAGTTLWIDKATFLIRRIDRATQFPTFHTVQTITYRPSINSGRLFRTSHCQGTLRARHVIRGRAVHGDVDGLYVDDILFEVRLDRASRSHG
jgi:hypothetical protein